MPLIIPQTLPAYKALEEENVFVMHRARAMTQDIRPLRILLVNLMPTKIATETQIARMLANSPLQVERRAWGLWALGAGVDGDMWQRYGVVRA